MKWWFAIFVVIWLAGGVMAALDMTNTASALTQIGLVGFAFMCGVSLGRVVKEGETG